MEKLSYLINAAFLFLFLLYLFPNIVSVLIISNSYGVKKEKKKNVSVKV
jgi:hypothetical protein